MRLLGQVSVTDQGDQFRCARDHVPQNLLTSVRAGSARSPLRPPEPAGLDRCENLIEGSVECLPHRCIVRPVVPLYGPLLPQQGNQVWGKDQAKSKLSSVELSFRVALGPSSRRHPSLTRRNPAASREPSAPPS